MNVYIKIMNREIPSYGLCIAVGVILANLLSIFYVMKKYKDDHLEDFLILESYVFLGAFVGSKLLYILISWKKIMWSEMIHITYLNKIMQGGFVFYGGLIGGLVFLYLGSRCHNLSTNKYLRHYIFAIPFIHSFGRIGCFEAGCCYGIPYTGYGNVIFPEDCFAPSGVPLLPIQLIEAVLLMILAVTILMLQIHKSWKYTIETYLISYGILRFVLEFFRYDEERGKIGVLTTSQIISLFLIILSILFLRKNRFRISL